MVGFLGFALWSPGTKPDQGPRSASITHGMASHLMNSVAKADTFPLRSMLTRQPSTTSPLLGVSMSTSSSTLGSSIRPLDRLLICCEAHVCIQHGGKWLSGAYYTLGPIIYSFLQPTDSPICDLQAVSTLRAPLVKLVMENSPYHGIMICNYAHAT